MKKSLVISKSIIGLFIVMLLTFTNCSMESGKPAGTIDGPEKNPLPGTPEISKSAAEGDSIQVEAESFDNMYGIIFEECKDHGGGQNAGWIDVDDWMEYSITIPEAGQYYLDYRVASETTLGKVQFKSGGTVLTETSIPNTTGWQIWTTERDIVTLQSGPQTIALHFTGRQCNLNWFKLTKKAAGFGRIEAENYDGFYDTTGSVGTQPCEDIGGGLNVGWIEPTEWLEYNITVPETGLYTINSRVASKYSPGALRILIDQTDVTGQITFNATGDWQEWTTIPSEKIALTEGPHVLRILFESKDININYVEFEKITVEWVPFYKNNASIEVFDDKDAEVTLHFNSSGYRVTDWGTLTKSDNTLNVDIKVETWTGQHSMVQTELKNSYSLGSLPDGKYTFNVNTWGNLTKSDLIVIGELILPEIPGKIEAEDYDRYYDTTPGNNGEVYKNDDVDIQECVDGGYNVGWIARGEWLEYDVEVKTAGKYLVKYRVASNSGSGALQLQVNGEVLAATRVLNTHDWQGWNDVYANVTLKAGPQTIRLYASGSDFNLNWFDFSTDLGNVVTVNGRQIMVNGEPFQIKGACWNPVPVGKHEDDEGVNHGAFVEQDGLLMQQAGINVVRTYWPITDRAVLDSLYEKGIYVINMMFMKNGVDYKMTESINAIKDHPAILMWGLGNEWNYNHGYNYFGGNEYERMVYLNNLADLVKSLDTTHPVITTSGGKMPEQWIIDGMHNIDVWGLQIYHGLGFQNAEKDWKYKSGKPMIFSEYGADSFNTGIWASDEDAQAYATKVLTNLILANSSARDPENTCAGGTIFEWSDEWWKAGDPDNHNAGGHAPGYGPYPDYNFNEEYWGIVRVDRTLKPAYYELKSIYNPE